MEKANGERPSLKVVSSAMQSLRAAMWGSACAAFRAAHAARVWVYGSDPEEAVLSTEDDRLAQWLFERGRRKMPSVKKRKHATTPAPARQQRRWKPTSRKRARTNGPASPSPPARRSSRGRVPRKASDAFFWNFKDEYVQALDELTAPTSGRIHTRNARRKRAAKRGIFALV